jgi:uncharacterized protein YqjF (DUF2071 family)
VAAKIRPFLTAKWHHLVMLNYEIDPEVLLPLVPVGTELDQWNGKTYISLVGFLFLETRVLGIPIPFHQNFEEVNLRFYVRCKREDGWQRAVVFVKEIVPRFAIGWVARTVYGENYVSMPMKHHILFDDQESKANQENKTVQSACYSWSHRGNENKMSVTLEGKSEYVEEGSVEEFITEHYWGYARRKNGRTMEYQVEHPSWRVTKAKQAELDCDIAQVYGDQFVPFLQSPVSAFLADGSEIAVHKGRLLPF